MSPAAHSFSFRDSTKKKIKSAIYMFFVLEMIFTVKKSHYAMAVEGEKVENGNLNGYLSIIPNRLKNHLSYILLNSIPEHQSYIKV